MDVSYALQKEGAMVGRPVVFCEFLSNLDAPYCFANPDDLANAIEKTWGGDEHPKAVPTVVFFGDLSQLDQEAVDAMHERSFTVAVQSNGSRALPNEVDWVSVTPEEGHFLSIIEGDEFNLPYPYVGADPRGYEYLSFTHFFLRPLDGSWENTLKAMQYCLDHPQWRLDLRTYEDIGVE